MNITIPGLSDEDNQEFNALLAQYGNGVYWNNEGWTREHHTMQLEAEQELQNFFNRKFTK